MSSCYICADEYQPCSQFRLISGLFCDLRHTVAPLPTHIQCRFVSMRLCYNCREKIIAASDELYSVCGDINSVILDAIGAKKLKPCGESQLAVVTVLTRYISGPHIKRIRFYI